jgi:hypothetical protein
MQPFRDLPFNPDGLIRLIGLIFRAGEAGPISSARLRKSGNIAQRRRS